MSSISGYWDTGPHTPLPVEPTWQEFAVCAGGEIVSRLLAEPRTFENADFIFRDTGVLMELKEIETEFSDSVGFQKRFEELMDRVLSENPGWKPVLLGGSDNPPSLVSCRVRTTLSLADITHFEKGEPSTPGHKEALRNQLAYRRSCSCQRWLHRHRPRPDSGTRSSTPRPLILVHRLPRVYHRQSLCGA